MIFLMILLTVCLSNSLQCANPKVSIITSVYNGDEFIQGFMEDITRQTIFADCQLIMINANSPGKEEAVIKKYMKHYPNIVYIRLNADPGLYGVWNMAIKMAQGKLLTNANLDDRLAPNCYEIHYNALRTHSEIDLVYSPCFITYIPNQVFDVHCGLPTLPCPAFSKAELQKGCIVNNHPMWRKSMHAKYGLFDEKYKIGGDWEMWLRAVSQGAQFMRIDQPLGLYYVNPHGLSTDVTGNAPQEWLMIYSQYKKYIVKLYQRFIKAIT